ncbi:hypothetical protein GSUB_17240 (plasmid) [Geoalkalibacter subterraneus]|uniref:Helicase ATP-binding domain-containing protein n=2 Tax=Geoalkalibacter subterraneus TaxID=483547 RepID=A0A0B5FVP4_9BACT|nr:hypothetical protein GSUB_17240 [Geoalkalibacter subterraneus]
MGKSRAMVQAALDLLDQHDQPVVISCPSISGLQQMLGELYALESKSRHRVAVALGRANFFEPSRVIDYLEKEMSEQESAPILQWIKDGARSTNQQDGGPLSRLYPQIGFLLEDLVHRLPEGFSIPDAALSQYDEESEAEEMYQQMRASLLDAKLIFCSHIMLACDQRLRKNREASAEILPEYAYLMLDEAHLFESAIASMESRCFSPFSLKSLLLREQVGSKANRCRAVGLCDEIIARAKRVKKTNFFIYFNEWNKKDFVVPSEVDLFLKDLSKMAQALDAILKGRKNKGASKELLDYKYVLSALISKKNNLSINISPVRRYPTFCCGPFTLNHVLSPIWQQPSLRGAAIVSATLFLPGAGADHIIKTLALPKDRLDIHPPIIPSWVTDPVVLHRPRNPMPWLPPQENEFDENRADDFETAHHLWCARLAAQTLLIAQDARSATLVLTTSYETAEEIGSKLSSLGDRLIVQKQNEPFANTRRTFEKLTAAGKKPVWVATGQAWTGLDLGDALSDLVITRIPFAGRGSRVGAGRGASKFDAAFTLRQGIGRLVRKEGCQTKNLWVFDGRIWLPQKQKFYKMFKDIFEVYDKREKS